MSLPDPLLLSDLLARRVRCDRGLEHGPGLQAWMHPPVHRLLGWASRPSALSSRRCIWRLDQLRGLSEAEVLVEGDPADTDAATLERLPTLLGATLLSGGGEPIGQLADAAFEPRSGRILHYLVARSDPRLPGGSRWRLSPDRIVDQRAGEVTTALQGLSDLPLARASLRETLLRRSRRWRDQWDEETNRLRDQWQQASGRFEERLEGWLEEPPWEDPRQAREPRSLDQEVWPEDDASWPTWPDALEVPERDWPDDPRQSWGADGPGADQAQPAADGPASRRHEPSGSRSRPGAPGRESRLEEPSMASGAWEGGDPDGPGGSPWSDDPDTSRAGRGGRRPPPLEESDDPWV